ncbi:glycosylation-dependent cell adhesion molecule 1 isoform 2 precursor [Mus musculus]|uniref:Glycosylation-dependent cell adhesion molecule 1 n=1 Tax=Mus musculus TaxID=10090 RepID=GLCM1_MOUSE|nr:glycosylation-dependent cell adhesion molecule 1 isoform 2 precursor [Mus musculus]Q02596.1 RecName: Full=Glycosylation-dependent cell adhesion molecule 1; Short=GlyCAM-1; AltName: Full=Endothelial ligand FOR L-selectin; AltName: Full=MC26; AltName: Full=SGP50; AltName: Full=Sulfated 50 kDa glycoprotein; Flags: Precursor [Mus musculus]AAA37710.1 endothelial ligand [Mus musculus]AAA79887.1 mucin-like glycoprotein [Mus musculus]AAI45833.1 Glycosylation dependent cell adhesion molecule 1 [Mus m|eukprot:NP_032160.1 glycosylation-dependent cell adhesion molecule 1 isoform 2 precursor [Mus musculus]
MKFFTVLLFVSLAATSLALLPGSKDELQMKTQPTDAIPAAQSTPTSYTSEESTSSKDLSKEPSIFREELISKDNVVIESTKPENQEAQDGLRSGSSQLEETTRPTTSAATTSEENLTKSSQTVEEELGKIIEGFVTGAEDIISGASRITKS